MAFHGFPEEFQGSLPITALREKAFQDFPLVIHGPPKIVRLAAYSGVIRPLIPKVSGHPFRFYPATDSGASGHPVM
jgi:hypothetical protein